MSVELVQVAHFILSINSGTVKNRYEIAIITDTTAITIFSE